MIYIYLHGFNSAYNPESAKIKALQTIGEVIGITYNTFGTYQEIFSEISGQVSDKEDLAFVGTSLGGFWASEMARHFGVPSVLINPCHDPYLMLRKSVGQLMTNYETGAENTLTNETIETYPVQGMSGDSRVYSYLPLVLLDMGDEVIDSFETRKVLEGFPMVHWAEGSHRFEHMEDALTDIKSYVNHCSYAEHLL